MKTIHIIIIVLLLPHTLYAARAKIEPVAENPYAAALLIDADSGKVLVEENADTQLYPASVLKLMNLLVILEKIDKGELRLDEMVQVTKEAAQMGGSQVYLDSKEQFSVEDLLYALMVQSANDAAVALAIHVAGSKSGFITLMNQKAAELGMHSTHFYSVHGLPPSKGQKVDLTTARDLALLGRELAKNPETFKYTSTRIRDFRDGKFVMRTHNHLLKDVTGCDGFKTGYFRAAGFSIMATAKRKGVRVIAVVLGSQDRKVRDAKARALLEKGFSMVPPVEKRQPADEKVAPLQSAASEVIDQPQTIDDSIVLPVALQVNSLAFTSRDLKVFFSGFGGGIIFFALLRFFIFKRKRKRFSRY